jgi:hypothetical protein
VADSAVQRELTQEGRARRRRLTHDSKGCRDCYREVQAAPILAQLCRREVHGQAATGKLQPTISDRGSDTLTGFLDGSCGHADQKERSLSTTVVGLHLDASRLETD